MKIDIIILANRNLEENSMEIREYTEYNEKEIVRLYTEVGFSEFSELGCCGFMRC